MRKIALSATRHFVVTPAKPNRDTRRVIILQNRDFDWTSAEIAQFRDMWNQGVPMPEMAKRLKRHERDLFLLWFDQYFEEKVIDDREGGYSGNIEIPLKSQRMA
jgi:hypothetical protein